MPRSARIKSESGYYHVLLRGINKQSIFNDEQDNLYFISLLSRYRKEHGYALSAYCLMKNHVHILIGDKKDELDLIMKKIAVSYARYYNQKYDRIGHLFQDRFKSEPIDSDDYFLTVLRYIHQNPVKAGIAEVDEYRWSSYNCYVSGIGHIDKDMTYELLGGLDEFKEFVDVTDSVSCLEIDKAPKMTDMRAEKLVAEVFVNEGISSLRNCGKEFVAETVDYFRRNGMSDRQINRLTGLSRNRLSQI